MPNVIIIFLLISSCLSAQQTLLFSEKGKFKVGGVDAQGNCYVIQRNTIYKFNKQGQVDFNFSDNSKGNITHLSCSNPLKITALYADQGKLIVLDNTLSPVGAVIDLHAAGISDPIAACAADDNGFWVYDAGQGKFVMMSWSGIKMQESTDVRRLFSKAFFPTEMTMISGNLLALSHNVGVVLTDNAGNIVKTLMTSGWVVSVGENGIYSASETGIVVQDVFNLSESVITTDMKGVLKFSMHFPYILMQYEKKISLYLLTAQD